MKTPKRESLPNSIPVRFSDADIGAIDLLALALERDRSWVIRHATRLFIEQKGAKGGAISKSLRDEMGGGKQASD